MANNLDAFTPEYWSARTQRLLKKTLIAREISNMEESSTLRDGDTVHRPTYSDITINNYVRGQDVTVQDVVATDEYLEVKTSKEATVYIDDLDVKQNKYDTANLYIDRMSYALKKDIDGTFLKEVLEAEHVAKDSNNPYSVSAANAFNMFTNVEAIMNANDIEDTKSWFAVITPEVKKYLQQTSMTNGFSMADASLKGIMKGMGYLGTRGNFNIFVSNNVAHTNEIATPTTAGTIIINGVTLTTKSSPANAWEAKNTVDAIVAAINGTPSADYVEFSAADRAKLTACGASAKVIDNKLYIVTNGKVAISGTLANASTVAHCWFGQYGCSDLVIQKDVTVQKNKAPLKTGWNYLVYTLYGIKTFTEWKKRCVDVQVVA